MNFDDIKKVWNQQDGNTVRIDTEVFLAELKRSRDYFRTSIIQRDIIEISAAVFCVIAFLFFGIFFSRMGLGFVWPMYFLAALSLYMVVFFIGDHVVQKRRTKNERFDYKLCRDILIGC